MNLLLLLKDGEDPMVVFQQALHCQIDPLALARFREEDTWGKRFAASILFS